MPHPSILARCLLHAPPKHQLTVLDITKLKRTQLITEGGKSDVICGTMMIGQAIEEVAIKGYRDDFNTKESIENEIRIWHILSHSHQNILQLIGVTTVDRYLSPAPVSSFCRNGNVSRFLRTNRDIDFHKRLRLLIDATKGLGHIHKMSIVHGDLKGLNVIIDDAGAAKLCDFGSSIIDCSCSSMKSGTEGSIWWDSPELWEDEEGNRTRESDIWALGCLSIEIQTGRLPYGTANPNVVSWRQASGNLPASQDWFSSHPASLRDGLWSTLNSCWQNDPTDRPDVGTVLAQLTALLPANEIMNTEIVQVAD